MRVKRDVVNLISGGVGRLQNLSKHDSLVTEYENI